MNWITLRTSWSDTKAPCKRVTRAVPGGRYKRSPLPSSFSAPMESRIVRESTREGTWNEIRAGKLALMSPVMTSTDGHNKIGELVDDNHYSRQFLMNQGRVRG